MINMRLTTSDTRGVQWCNRFCSKLTFSRGHILSEHIMLSCAFFRQENRLTMNIQKFKLEHIKDWIERSKLNTWGSLLSKRRGQIFDDRGEINKHVGPPSGSIYFVTMRPRGMGNASKTGCKDQSWTLEDHFCPNAAARSLTTAEKSTNTWARHLAPYTL